MQKIKKVFQLITGFILIALLIWGTYFLFKAVGAIFSSVDPKLAAGMIAGSATIFVSVITVLFSKKQEHKVDIQNQLREKLIRQKS